jgi:hypothetical protein
VRKARLRYTDESDQADAQASRHGNQKSALQNAARSRVAPAPRSFKQLRDLRFCAYFGRREVSPLASAISAMREPLIPTHEFLVRGYLSV